MVRHGCAGFAFLLNGAVQQQFPDLTILVGGVRYVHRSQLAGEGLTTSTPTNPEAQSVGGLEFSMSDLSVVQVPARTVAFPPPDGAFVTVDTPLGQVRGLVAVYRYPTPWIEEDGGAYMAVLPLARGAVAWQGYARADKVTIDPSVAQPKWWRRTESLLLDTMRARAMASAGEQRLLEAVRALSSAEQAQAESRRVQDEHARNLQEGMRQWARENGVGEQFTHFAAEWGIAARGMVSSPARFEVEVGVAARLAVYIPVPARTSEEAEGFVDADQVAEAVLEDFGLRPGRDMYIDGWSVTGTVPV